MIMTNRLLPVALVAALIGGSVGAFVMHNSNPTKAEAQMATLANTGTADAQEVQYQASQTGTGIPTEFNTASEQGAYKTGFADGFGAAQGGVTASRLAPVTANRLAPVTGRRLAPVVASTQQRRVVYRNTGRSARSSQQNSRRAYYDYQQQPRGRSFWQKHRDKLTVAMGAGGGAVVGGLIGGKKGAAIGALGGGGGSALYTYKLRKRNRNY